MGMTLIESARWYIDQLSGSSPCYSFNTALLSVDGE